MTTFDCADPVARRAGLEAAAHAARTGNLVVMPTDTVYGIGADAFNAAAVRALLAAKGRGPDMPVPVLVGSWTTIDGLVMAVPPVARTLIEAFWPGGLSLVVEHAPSLSWDLGDARGHRHGADAAAPGGARPVAAGRPDGRVQREPQRQPAGHHRGGRRSTSSATTSRCTWRAASRRSGWPRPSSTSTVAGAAGAASGRGEHRPAARRDRRRRATGLTADVPAGHLLYPLRAISWRTCADGRVTESTFVRAAS